MIDPSEKRDGVLTTPAGACLIPRDDPISELLEDIRLERSSYELIDDPSTLGVAQHCAGELVGLFILAGSVEVTCQSAGTEQLGKADFILLSPGQSYSVHRTTGERCSVGRVTYGVDIARARLLLRLLPPSLVIRRLSEAEIEWQLTLARLISAKCADGDLAVGAINRRLVEAALIGVIQQYLVRNAQLRSPTAGPLLAEVSPSIQAMHRHPDQPWTISGLAQLSGMSRTLFAAKFLESTGETPGRYLTRLRMERARHLLCSSQLSLATIAHRAGYGTDVAFARAFKRQYGTSPGRYRADRH
ncbi:MAG: hypothetical protein JWR77_1526 [Rhizorhabdus sp.]|nr:hypothetical protein [Rhizorhabdus sp.]